MIEKDSVVENFTLPGIDENGVEKEFSLYDFKGKDIVFVFLSER